jgi:hypothetical protein
MTAKLQLTWCSSRRRGDPIRVGAEREMAPTKGRVLLRPVLSERPPLSLVRGAMFCVLRLFLEKLLRAGEPERPFRAEERRIRCV